MAAVQITEYTDPGCPFAFSAEPIRWRLKWLYGDQLEWHLRMVVLSESGRGLRREGTHGGDPGRWQRSAGARARNADGHARQAAPVGDGARLPGGRGGTDARPGARVAAAAPAARPQLRGPVARRAVDDRRRGRGRRPRPGGSSPRGWRDGSLRGQGGRAQPVAGRAGPGRTSSRTGRAGCGTRARPTSSGCSVPGFQPWAAYEVALANVAPGLERRDPPTDVTELLRWAGTPLASKEVAVVMDTDVQAAREALGRVAVEHHVGADGFWSLTGLTPRMRVAICFAARIVCSASSRSSPPAGKVTATAAIGCRAWSSTAVATLARPGRDEPVLLGEAVGPRRVQELAQLRQRGGAGRVASRERAAVGEQRVELGRGERGEHREAACGQVRGEADADVGHQVRPVRRALLDHVEDVPAVQHRQVRVVRGGVDEARQDGLRDPSQRFLADVGGADLVRGDAQAVAALLGEVDDEPLVGEDLEQVVGATSAGGRGALRDRRRRERLRVAGQQAQDLERVGGCGGVGHGAPLDCLRYETRPRTAASRRGRTARAARPSRLDVTDLPLSQTTRSMLQRRRRLTLLGAAVDAVSDPRRYRAAIRGARTPALVNSRLCSSRTRSPSASEPRPSRTSSPSRATTRPSSSPPRRSQRSRRPAHVIDALAADTTPHYGVSTGFGALATRHIPHRQAHPAPAQPHPQPRGRQRSRGRAERSSAR